MPWIDITIVEGRDMLRKQAMCRAVARAVHEELGAPLETIRVVVREVAPELWCVGDRPKKPVDPSGVA